MPVSPEAGIRAAIRDKYTKVAASASGKFQYPTGREGAAGLGYDPALIAKAPSAMLESFCGVGNPFSLGPVRQGEALLDFGCGAGFDLFVAAHLVGKAGSVCGIDLTPDMADCARRNLVQAGIERFEIKTIASEHIAYADKTFDVVISNGVINLCIEKKTCFTEIYRVLKPGGRLQFADVVLEKEIPKNLSDSAEAWSQ